jgi:hypothetical protein
MGQQPLVDPSSIVLHKEQVVTALGSMHALGACLGCLQAAGAGGQALMFCYDATCIALCLLC